MTIVAAVPLELGLHSRPGLGAYEHLPPEGWWTDLRFYVPSYMGPAPTLDIMAGMPELAVVQMLTAGFDNALRSLPDGVVLCNAAGVHDASTAEIAVGLVISSLRGIDDFARAMPQGQWLRGRRESLADKRVVVVGAGGVGKAIRDRLEPFECDVVLVGRSARPGVLSSDDLGTVVKNADVVILAVPLDESTRGMVDDGFLATMKPGALLVNVARGPVVDTDALVNAVAEGRVRAALDVTDPEPLPADHPLWQVPGVLISPHVGGNSSAFVPRARRLVEAQLSRWESGQPLEHVVAVGGS